MTKRERADATTVERLAVATKGLAHPARLRMVGMLATGELCVCQMTAVLGLAPSTVSQHLSVLERGGWVGERKVGKLVFYRLRDDGPAAALLPPLRELLAGEVGAKSDRALLARLRKVPVAELCAAELDRVAIGLRRAAGSGPAAAARA